MSSLARLISSSMQIELLTALVKIEELPRGQVSSKQLLPARPRTQAVTGRIIDVTLYGSIFGCSALCEMRSAEGLPKNCETVHVKVDR